MVNILPAAGRRVGPNPGPGEPVLEFWTAPTDEHGEIRWRPRDLGAVTIQAVHADSSLFAAPTLLETPPRRVSLVARPSSRLVVRAVDARTRAAISKIPRTEVVEASTKAKVSMLRFTPSERGLSLDWFGEGRYAVQLTYPGYRPWKRDVSFPHSGATVEIDVVLDPEE
jgi:hypothetical protein